MSALAIPVRAADRLRIYWLRALGPLAKPLIRRRELRVAVAGSSLVLLALVTATFLPLWALAVGPVVWGTPHVLSDVRYLLVRPGHHRRPSLWIVVGIPLLALSVTAEPIYGFVAVLGATLFARGPVWKKLLILPVAAALIGLAYRESFLTAVFFAHAHNVIGVALFWAWRRRKGWLHALPLGLFVLGIALILSGALDPLVDWSGALLATPGGVGVYYHLASLAPDTDYVIASRVVLSFAFAQSVHYVVWVRLIPEEDRQRETPRTFAATLRALRSDFGAVIVGLALLSALGLAVWAVFDLFAARLGYLRAILFHGYLELAAAALLFVEGLSPRGSTAKAPAS